MGLPETLRRALRPLGALAGVTGAAALFNRSLRNEALPLDHVGGIRIPWRWRGYEIFATELGAGPEILLVHGIYAGASSYEFRTIAPLLARDHRVVAFDLLGCGLSAMPNLAYSGELFVEQIVDAIGALTSGPLVLVGSSMGGAFAIRAAVRAPDRVKALVTIAPTGLAGILDKEATAAQRAVGEIFRSPIAGEAAFNALSAKPTIRWFLGFQSYADKASVTTEIVDHYYAVTHQPGARFVPAHFVGGALNIDVARDLPFVESPLLVVWGERAPVTSPVANAEAFVRLARDGRMATFPDAGLLVHEERAGDVADAILDFARATIATPATRFQERLVLDRTAPEMSKTSVPDIFKSYDIRGICPGELDDDLAYAIGRAFVDELHVTSVVVGRDMRPTGVGLFEAFARGANEAGADVTDIGLVSTDALYFAVGKYDFAGGVMITASHNPANYNGMKLTRDRAQAISFDTGLRAIRDRDRKSVV